MISKDSRNTQFTSDSIPTLDQDAGKDVPLYVQIYDILYELIQSGDAPRTVSYLRQPGQPRAEPAPRASRPCAMAG